MLLNWRPSITLHPWKGGECQLQRVPANGALTGRPQLFSVHGISRGVAWGLESCAGFCTMSKAKCLDAAGCYSRLLWERRSKRLCFIQTALCVGRRTSDLLTPSQESCFNAPVPQGQRKECHARPGVLLKHPHQVRMISTDIPLTEKLSAYFQCRQ